MTRSFLLFAFLNAIAVSWAQTPPAATPAPEPAAAAQPKARGPEAVAALDPNRVVATIDGKQITAKQAADMLKPYTPEQRRQLETDLPKFVQQTYMRGQLAEAAKKLNLDQQSPLREQIEIAHDTMMAQAYLQHLSQNSGTPPAAEVESYFNAHPGDFDSVHLSGIFVQFSPPGTPAGAAHSRTEAQAREKVDDLEKKLKAGTDFAALARTDSDNQASAAKGGDLGPFIMDNANIPANIKSAIAKLEPGQFSDPIQIPNAFLIVKLMTRNKATLEQSRAAVAQHMQQEKSQAALKQELDKYQIQVQDSDFFNTANASGAKIPSLQRPAPSVSAPPPPPPPPGQPKS
jgi:parvulin-like peptidyl-prolyl isomerase